jgi:intracellular protein transport protein USO1
VDILRRRRGFVLMEGLLGKSLGAFLSQPKQQEPEDIVRTLCNRLQHGTNLEDRRAAVLGLRGFSRDFQEVLNDSQYL